MHTLKSKLLNWFYTTYLGYLYFKFLLWLDARKEKNSIKYLSPKEMAQIVKEYSLIGEGIKQVKHKINSLVHSRTREEYEKILIEIENLIPLAENDKNSEKYKFINMLRSKMDLSNSDIKTVTDRAKMIEKRINDMKELQNDVLKRRLLRSIRKAELDGNKELVTKLKCEFREKYEQKRENR